MSSGRSLRRNGSDLRSKSSVPAPTLPLSPSELAQLAANFQTTLRTTSYRQVVMADGQSGSADANANPTGTVLQLPVGGIPKSFNHGHMVSLVTTVNHLVTGFGQFQQQLTQVNQAVTQASQSYSNLATRLASDNSTADDSFAEMEASTNELRSGMKQILGLLSVTTGPVDPAAVQAALVDDEATAASIKQFGAEWALTVHSQWPDQWVEQAQLLKLWSDHKNSKPSGTPIPVGPFLHAHEQRSASMPLRVQVPLGSLPSGPVSPVSRGSVQLAHVPVSLPFGSAMAGRHFKVELPKPKFFSRISSDVDIQRWLIRIQEYMTLIGHDLAIWAVVASQFLDKVPLQLWEARKARLVAENSFDLYSWESFRSWCLSSFSVQDHERNAITQLMSLRQTGSVAEYKVAHDVLAAYTDLPVKQQLIDWEQGLKPDIRAECKLDPATHTSYQDIAKAQSAAMAIDIHLNAAATKKRTSSSSTAPSLAAASVKAKQPKKNICEWRIQDDQFTCGKTGSLAKPLPKFFQEWLDTCHERNGRKLLPKAHMVKEMVTD